MKLREFPTICQTILVFAIAAFLAAVLWPVFPERPASKGVICLSNIKRIALGGIMYESDYDDVLPRRAWMDALWPYLKNERLFHDPEFPTGRFGYVMNFALQGTNMSKRKDESTTPMVFDSTIDAPNAWASVSTLPVPGRHNGKNNIAYADGHARAVIP